MKNLIAIQHCQSEQHLNGMVGGWTDWPLTALGERQAHSIGKAMAEELGVPSGYTLISSDLIRARRTAEIVGEYLNLTPQWMPALREIGSGASTGKTRAWAAENRAERPIDTLEIDHRYFEGGETPRDVYLRVGSACDELLVMDTENLIIVSHGMAFGLFTMYFLGIPIEHYETVLLHGVAGGVTRLQVNDDGRRILRSYGDTRYGYTK